MKGCISSWLTCPLVQPATDHWLFISAPTTQCPCIVSATAAGPKLNLPFPSSLSVAVGNERRTYAPDQFARLCRRQEERRVHVPKPRGVATGSQRWDVDHGLDDPCDQIPILGDMDWNHRLDVEEINHVIMLWACGEVVVILERHTDQISHRVLRLLHKFCVFVFLFVGFLWLRSLRGHRCEQKKNA